VGFELKCARDAYKMLLSAQIEQDGSTISGNWFEASIAKAARSLGRVPKDLSKQGLKATPSPLMTIRTKTNHQTFTLESPPSR
jgi:hypothetical protein